MNQLQASLCLLCVTFCWSMEVIIFSVIPKDVSPFATTCITFLAGGLLLLLAFFGRIRKQLKQDGKKLLLRCIFLSILNGAYNTLYQFGLDDFDVFSGAFAISLTAVVTPVVLLVLHSKSDKRTWISSILILIGIGIALSKQVTEKQIPALLLIVLGCIIRSFYFIKLNQFAREHDPVTISSLTCISGGIIYFIVWTFIQPSTFFAISWNPTIIASLAIYSYFVVALTITLNIFAQKSVTPTRATIIYSLEIVFTIILGLLLPASMIERVPLSPFMIIGVVCILLGNIISVIDFKAIRETAKGGSA